jgi:hypothetical protein
VRSLAAQRGATASTAWEKGVRPAWLNYLAKNDWQGRNAQDFVDHYADWKPPKTVIDRPPVRTTDLGPVLPPEALERIRVAESPTAQRLLEIKNIQYWGGNWGVKANDSAAR